jgi:hypothetical protein
MASKGLNLESIARGGMAKKELPYHAAAPVALSEYESKISPDASEARDDDIDTYADDLKDVLKGHLKQQRQTLIDAGIIDKKDRFTGYGKVSDKHVDPHSGRKLKEALAHDAMKTIGAYTLTKLGYSESFIKELLGGMGAMKKEKKGDQDMIVPDHTRRRAYEKQFKTLMDGYLGRPGMYDSLVSTLAKEKSLSKALRGDLGKVLEQYAKNIHPDNEVIKGYQSRLESDLKEAESFKAHTKKIADKKGYEIDSTDLGVLVNSHLNFVSDPKWKPDDDQYVKPKKKAA